MGIFKYLSNFSMKFSISKTARELRQGLVYTLPLIFIGSISTLVLNFPIPSVHNFLDAIFSNYWRDFFTSLNNGSFKIISIIAFIGISYSIFMDDDDIQYSGINPILPVLVILGSYFVLTSTTVNVINEDYASSKRLFVAIMLSLIISKSFLWIFKKTSFNFKVFIKNDNLILNQISKIAFPTFIIFCAVALLRIFIVAFNVNEIFANYYFNFIGKIVNNTSKLLYAFVFDLVSQLMWFIGIHGNNILDSLTKDITSHAMEINQSLVELGITPTQIFSKEFFDVFVYMGGSGATISLIIAIFLKSREESTKKLGLVSILPAIFNINEILIFGFPIVLNPFLFIPFLITPIVSIITTYIAMKTNFVPVAHIPVAWTSPIFLNAYITTGNSINAIILQIINITIGVFIYMPFVVIYENYILEHQQTLVKKVMAELNAINTDGPKIITKKDDVGHFARNLAKDIYNALYYNENPMHLEFQPQIDSAGNVMGCESLLRWEHKRFGRISPILIITIASEAGLIDELGNWVIRTAFDEMGYWREQGLGPVFLSVNVFPTQLDNPQIIDVIKETIKKHNFDTQYMEFEITESIGLSNLQGTKDILAEIKSLGARIAIDDFGMGHSSLLYIKSLIVDTVKIDGSLIKDIHLDSSSQEIITSIVKLCDMLGLRAIAEVVETKEQRDELKNLGCDIYQGYLYSQSLKTNDFMDFVRERTPKG